MELFVTPEVHKTQLGKHRFRTEYDHVEHTWSHSSGTTYRDLIGSLMPWGCMTSDRPGQGSRVQVPHASQLLPHNSKGARNVTHHCFAPLVQMSTKGSTSSAW